MQDDLFTPPPARPGTTGAHTPLAARVRPRRLAEVVGQDEPREQLARMFASDLLVSLVLWGPPGTGKTTLARLVAVETDAHWVELSAVSCGVKDVRTVIDQAAARLDVNGRRTVLFLDECHRFSKSQQDVLLPAVEDGTVTFIGATTENPYFDLNAALLSRCELVRLATLTDEQVASVLHRAVAHPNGYDSRIALTDDAAELLAQVADGDARAALTLLEAAATLSDEQTVTADLVTDTRRRLRYDRTGDRHYDQISAYIKSIRGSDPDAAAYWLVRMLNAGEDPKYLARRLVIAASEDIGLAANGMLALAVAAFDTVERIGMPEARYALMHVTLALASAPKSGSATAALRDADRLVARTGNLDVPIHLRDRHYAAARKLGHGDGYKFPHDYPGGWVDQQYLPDEIADQQIYRPTSNGQEPRIVDQLNQRRDA